jgi:energy-coupling factor transporter ATP-binding protein EcfA2
MRGEGYLVDQPVDLTDTITMVSQNPNEQLLMTTAPMRSHSRSNRLGLEREKLLERVQRALEGVELQNWHK